MASKALAQSAEPVALELSFEGASDCEDRSVLEREIERRSESVRWTTGALDATRVDVRIVGSAEGFDALVRIQRPAATGVTRTITSRTCREAMEGAALIVAVVLPRRTPEAGPKRAAPARSSLESKNMSPGLGSSGALVMGVAPSMLPALEVFADVSTFRSGWSPALRAGFRHAAGADYPLGGGDARARFEINAAGLSICPIAWLATSRLVARPCVSGSYGRLKASSVATDAHPWGSIGLTLRLEARLLKALSVELEGSSDVALFSERFWLGQLSVHETSRVGARVALGLVARLPE